jgi:hypothetical protein
MSVLKTKDPRLRVFLGGRYWARTSDPQLVDPIYRVTSRYMWFRLFSYLQDFGASDGSSGVLREAAEYGLRVVQALDRHWVHRPSQPSPRQPTFSITSRSGQALEDDHAERQI